MGFCVRFSCERPILQPAGKSGGRRKQGARGRRSGTAAEGTQSAGHPHHVMTTPWKYASAVYSLEEQEAAWEQEVEEEERAAWQAAEMDYDGMSRDEISRAMCDTEHDNMWDIRSWLYIQEWDLLDREAEAAYIREIRTLQSGFCEGARRSVHAQLMDGIRECRSAHQRLQEHEADLQAAREVVTVLGTRLQGLCRSSLIFASKREVKQLQRRLLQAQAGVSAEAMLAQEAAEEESGALACVTALKNEQRAQAQLEYVPDVLSKLILAYTNSQRHIDICVLTCKRLQQLVADGPIEFIQTPNCQWHTSSGLLQYAYGDPYSWLYYRQSHDIEDKIDDPCYEFWSRRIEFMSGHFDFHCAEHYLREELKRTRFNLRDFSFMDDHQRFLLSDDQYYILSNKRSKTLPALRALDTLVLELYTCNRDRCQYCRMEDTHDYSYPASAIDEFDALSSSDGEALSSSEGEALSMEELWKERMRNCVVRKLQRLRTSCMAAGEDCHCAGIVWDSIIMLLAQGPTARSLISLNVIAW